MTEQRRLEVEEQDTIIANLLDGRPDDAFMQLARYLDRNNFKLSDPVLQKYIELELFACFEEKSHLFSSIVNEKPK